MPTPPPENPFALLGFEPQYRLDSAEIERAYLARITASHPDTGGEGHAGGSDAADLNEAREILLDDERRAVALLKLLGGPDSSQCKDLPDRFLMEMMTRREEIEEEIQAGGEHARENWEQWARRERANYRRQAEERFDALSQPPDEDSLRAVRVTLNAWRYIERLIEQLDPDYDPARADFR